MGSAVTVSLAFSGIVDGYIGDADCQNNPDVYVYLNLSGQVPPGMDLLKYDGGYDLPRVYDVRTLVGQPSVPGVYELTGTYSQSSATTVCQDMFGGTYGCSCPSESFSVPLEIVVTEAQVDSLEVTQAIQVNKSPVDLAAWLAWQPPPTPIGDMPVPLVENKPVFLRVYLKEVQTPTVAKVRMWLVPPNTGPAEARKRPKLTVLTGGLR